MRLRATRLSSIAHRGKAVFTELGEFFINGVKITNLSSPITLAAGANTITGTGTGTLSEIISNSKTTTIPVLTSATGVATTGGNVTISSSNFYGAGFEAWKACDGIGSTNFVTNLGGNNWWIQAQYTTPIVPSSITLKGRTDQVVNYPNAGVVEGSNDGTNWTTLIVSVPPLPPGSGDQTFAISTTTAYSQIRYRSTQKNPGALNDNIGLATFQVSALIPSTLIYALDVDAVLTIAGANTYISATTINSSGIIKAANLLAFGTGAITVNAGGTLNKNGLLLVNSITNNGGTVIN